MIDENKHYYMKQIGLCNDGQCNRIHMMIEGRDNRIVQDDDLFYGTKQCPTLLCAMIMTGGEGLIS